uniref:Uncharacterized protein n=1 Tax=Megaselia scalaris TaxID=36166 RepID=T1GN59_MEGSC
MRKKTMKNDLFYLHYPYRPEIDLPDNKFSDPKTDPHSVKLLTLVRTLNNTREENLVCLTILLSARDKAIVVSTNETLLTPSKSMGDWEPEGGDDNNARIWCPDL